MANVSDLRALAVEYMVSREKMNSYTQGSRRNYFFGYPDNIPGSKTQQGFSDCSSAVRKAIMAASGIDIGSNTNAQINNRNTKGLIVHQTDGYLPDESALLMGDCLYFKGNTGHALDVGHVEMYIGDGKICGHGSGTGPRIRDMRQYCASRSGASRRYFMAIRWITGDGETADRTLRYGMEGEDVKVLQQSLIFLGYDLGAYGADGDFGPATQAAVAAFQANNGLTADGVAGAQTRAKIAELMEAKGDTSENEAPQSAPSGADCIVIADGRWNVRTGPSADYPSAGVVSGGDVLERIDIGGWIPVLCGGEVRFISPRAVKG